VHGLASSASESVYADLKDERYWFRTIIVQPDDFTVPKLEHMARSFVGAAAGRVLAVLSVFTDVKDAAMATTVNRDSYQAWSAYYDALVQKPLRMAEVTAVKGDVVLRIRSHNGAVLTRVLTGHDPLQVVESSGALFEILLVRPRVGTVFDRCDPGPSLAPVLYLKTDARLTETLCRRACRRLGELLNARKMFVHFRNDHWFISFGGFPVVYPFAKSELPPTERAYYDSVAFTCSVSCDEQESCLQTLGPHLTPPPRRTGDQ
jgi:hypothetical protein